MSILKIADGVYRLPMKSAGEYVGIHRNGSRWIVSHPRVRRALDSFTEAKRVARAFIADLDGRQDKPDAALEEFFADVRANGFRFPAHTPREGK